MAGFVWECVDEGRRYVQCVRLHQDSWARAAAVCGLDRLREIASRGEETQDVGWEERERYAEDRYQQTRLLWYVARFGGCRWHAECRTVDDNHP
jgi:hypothetical protein